MAVDIGESGALISAILESEGYIYQSEILDKLAPIQEGNVVGLVGAAAAFIFVAALVWGGIQYVFSGGFKFTWWMLIGPTLFFLAVIPRVEVNNTIWKFPNSKDKDQNEVSKYLGRANDLYNTNGSDSKSKVSNVYAEYNKMISIVVNEIVEKIVGSIKELDSKFISRMEKIADLQFLTAQDPGARELFGTILMWQCREYFTYASKAFATEGTSNSNPVQQGYRQKLEEIKDKEIVVMKGFKYAPEFLANGVAKYGDTYLKIENCQAGNNVSNFIKKLESPNNVENANIKELTGKIEKMTCSCENIWLLSYLTLYYEAYSGAEAIKSKANDDVNEDFKVDLFNVLKIVQLKELEEAENSNTEAPKAPRETISDYLKRHPEAFYGLIARHVLSNNIQDSNAPGHFIADQRVKQNQQVLAFSGANQPFSRVERNKLDRTKYVEEYKVMVYAMQLPYYQGVILFFLSILYPFFALMLLFPGKYIAFIQWFLFWMWAKSWDIGFAMVMLLEQLLFNIMLYGEPPLSSSEIANPSELKNPLDADLSLALLSLRYVNPSMHYTTYYTILGVALASIPLISGYLILRASGSIASMFTDSANSYAKEATAGVGNYFSQAATTAALSKESMNLFEKQKGEFNKNLGQNQFNKNLGQNQNPGSQQPQNFFKKGGVNGMSVDVPNNPGQGSNNNPVPDDSLQRQTASNLRGDSKNIGRS